MREFLEDLNTAVITTRYVLENKSPILYIFHYDEDGAWQFSGNEENLDDEDYRVISLEEIIKLDDSVQEVLDMPLGFEAHRKNVQLPWEIVKTK